MNHLVEEFPVVFFDQISLDIFENVISVKKMMTIKLPFCSHNLHSWQKCMILIWCNYFRKSTNNVRKCFENLNISFLALLIAKNKTKRNQLFWRTYSCKYSHSPCSTIFVSFLNNIVCKIKAHKMTKMIEILFHERAGNDHEIWKLVHLVIVRITLNLVLFFIE